MNVNDNCGYWISCVLLIYYGTSLFQASELYYGYGLWLIRLIVNRGKGVIVNRDYG